MSLPLYEIIYNQVPIDKDLSIEEKKECCQMISQLDNQGFNNIYLLMRTHGIKEHGDTNLFDIPYGGTESSSSDTYPSPKKNLKFNLESLPLVLKQMIYKFCKVHLQKFSDHCGKG